MRRPFSASTPRPCAQSPQRTNPRARGPANLRRRSVFTPQQRREGDDGVDGGVAQQQHGPHSERPAPRAAERASLTEREDAQGGFCDRERRAHPVLPNGQHNVFRERLGGVESGLGAGAHGNRACPHRFSAFGYGARCFRDDAAHAARERGRVHLLGVGQLRRARSALQIGQQRRGQPERREELVKPLRQCRANGPGLHRGEYSHELADERAAPERGIDERVGGRGLPLRAALGGGQFLVPPREGVRLRARHGDDGDRRRGSAVLDDERGAGVLLPVQGGEDRPFGDAYRVPVEVGDGVDDVAHLAGDIDEPALGGTGEYERAVGVGGDIRAEGLFEGVRAAGAGLLADPAPIPEGHFSVHRVRELLSHVGDVRAGGDPALAGEDRGTVVGVEGDGEADRLRGGPARLHHREDPALAQERSHLLCPDAVSDGDSGRAPPHHVSTLPRERVTSYKVTPRATEALSDSISERIGMETIMSQVSRTSRLNPLSSEPSTTTSGSAASPKSSIVASPPASRPTTNSPCFLYASRVRTRFVTCATRTRAAAPAETFHAVALTLAERREGMTTPSAPNAEAERRAAPRLWGSVIPSRARMRGVCASRRSSASSYSYGWIRAMTPW